MASAKAGTHVLQLKPVQVPELLCKGDRFFKFDDGDSGSSGCFVILRMDPKGYILYWATATDSETEYLDLSMVLDVRFGKFAKIPKESEKAREQLAGSFVIPASAFDSSFFTVVSGNNMVDINFLTFLAPSSDVSKEWAEAIFNVATNQLAVNGSVSSFICRTYAKIRFGFGDKVKTKDVVKLFTANREEKKGVEKALASAHVPIGKDDCIIAEKLNEDMFFQFYHLLCQRNEVGRIFCDLTDVIGGIIGVYSGG